MDRAPRNYLKTTYILAIADVIILFSGLNSDWTNNTQMMLLIPKGIIGLWIGLIINWIYAVGCIPSRLPVLAYWTFFVLALLSGGGLLTIVQLLIAITLVMKCTYSKQKSESIQAGSSIASSYFDDEIEKRDRIKKKEKSIWPVYALSGLLIVSFAMIIIVAATDTSEFGGLGLLFILLFFTPMIFIISSMLTTAVADRMLSIYSGLQLIIYVSMTASWVILFARILLER